MEIFSDYNANKMANKIVKLNIYTQFFNIKVNKATKSLVIAWLLVPFYILATVLIILLLIMLCYCARCVYVLSTIKSICYSRIGI